MINSYVKLFLAGVCTVLATPALSSNLTIEVKGLKAPYGEVGCSLFASPEGFPMDGSKAETHWMLVQSPTVQCEFRDLTEGEYAFSIAHDQNGNRKVDTNFLGIPLEQWGVSNNVRPLMRAPKFNEAKFLVKKDSSNLKMTVEVGQ